MTLCKQNIVLMRNWIVFNWVKPFDCVQKKKTNKKKQPPKKKKKKASLKMLSSKCVKKSYLTYV